jgi:hypothetical protein
VQFGIPGVQQHGEGPGVRNGEGQGFMAHIAGLQHHGQLLHAQGKVPIDVGSGARACALDHEGNEGERLLGVGIQHAAGDELLRLRKNETRIKRQSRVCRMRGIYGETEKWGKSNSRLLPPAPSSKEKG